MASGSKNDGDERARQRKDLTRTIQAEIIPRLMLAHRMDGSPGLERPQTLDGTPALDGAQPVTLSAEIVVSGELDLLAFVERLLRPTNGSALEFIAPLRGRGIAIETIFLDLLAPAAHHLGTLWETDEASFTDVTIGLTHLQQLVRELAPTFELDQRFGGSGHRAVLAPAPGDQHVFGLILLEEFFRRAGWDVIGAAVSQELDLLELVRNEYVALLGFSIADSRSIEPLQTLVKRLREESINEHLIIMVGGNCVLEDPSLVAKLGADETGRTALDAVSAAVVRVTELALLNATSREV